MSALDREYIKALQDTDDLRMSLILKFQDENKALKEIGEGLLIVIKSVYIKYPEYTELKNVIREATEALKGERNRMRSELRAFLENQKERWKVIKTWSENPMKPSYNLLTLKLCEDSIADIDRYLQRYTCGYCGPCYPEHMCKCGSCKKHCECKPPVEEYEHFVFKCNVCGFKKCRCINPSGMKIT